MIARTLQHPARSAAPETRRVKQVSPLVRDQLVADYRAGLGIYELARKHGLHCHTVSPHLAAAGVVMRRTITDSESARAVPTGSDVCCDRQATEARPDYGREDNPSRRLQRQFCPKLGLKANVAGFVQEG